MQWAGDVYPSMELAGGCVSQHALGRGAYHSMHWGGGVYHSMHWTGGSVCPEGGVCSGGCLPRGLHPPDPEADHPESS